MKPSALSWPLRVKSTANQMKVASTSPSFAMSSRVKTPAASRMPRPRNATAVESRPIVAAAPQSATMPRKVAATIFSCRRKGPMASRARRAATGASGVEVTSGRTSL